MELRRKTREELAKKTPEKLAEVAANEAALWTSTMLRKARELLELLPTTPEGLRGKTKKVVAGSKEGPLILDLPWMNEPKDIKALVDALEKADQLGRRSLGLVDPGKATKEEAAPDQEEQSMLVVPADSEDWRSLIDGDEGSDEEEA